MYTYKSVVITTTRKWIKDSASLTDIRELDNLINNKTAKGWEFVCHSYMPNINATRSAILVTFRKEKEEETIEEK